MTNNAGVRASCCIALLLTAAATAQEAPVTLQVELENQVRYGEDVDRSQIGRSAVPVPATPGLNFNRGIVIGDIVGVNGSPAKGTTVNLVNDLRLTPTPVPGAAISDVALPALSLAEFYFLRSDGVPVGTIFGMGVQAAGMTIVGGTGAFVGARGTINPGTAATPLRVTSQAEDP